VTYCRISSKRKKKFGKTYETMQGSNKSNVGKDDTDIDEDWMEMSGHLQALASVPPRIPSMHWTGS
jgi:hypothetical protein